MIEESYVSFDTAKLLKEVGFNVPCRGVYITDRIGHYEFHKYDNKQTVDDLCQDTEDGFQYEYLAPTQDLAARWLREEHHIFIMLTPVIEGWMYDLFDLKKHQYILCNEDAMTESYEVAFETALREAIKLIKK